MSGLTNTQAQKDLLGKIQFGNDSALKGVLESSRSQTFVFVVLVPVLLLSFYYVTIAADRYVSTASFKVSKGGAKSVEAGPSAALAAAAGFSNENDEYLIENYILSIDMLKMLDDKLALRSHFSAHPDADFISKMSASASLEDFHEYYQGMISTSYDELSGLLTLEVQTFSPDYSKRLLEEILSASELMVNDKSKQLALSQLEFVEEGLAKSAEHMASAQLALNNFQNTHTMFNPEAKGATVINIISSLEQELSATRASLSALQEYQQKDSPEVMALRHKIRGLESQISKENKRLVSGQGSESLNQFYAEFKGLELAVQVAQQNYATALAALESARLESSQKLKHLVVISSPHIAEDAKYPRKLYNVFTLAVILLMLFGIIRMTITTINQHQD